MDNQEFVTRKHLADLLEVSPSTIIRMEKQGLPVHYIGDLPRYVYEDVKEWIFKQQKKARTWMDELTNILTWLNK